MSVIAEIQMSHPNLLLQPTISTIDSLMFQYEYETWVKETCQIVMVAAIGNIPDELEAIISQDSTIKRTSLVAEFSNQSVFALWPSPQHVPIPNKLAELGGFIVSMRSDGIGWTIRLVLPGRHAIMELRDHYNSQNVSFRINRLNKLSGTKSVSNQVLTGKQRDILITALQYGYFDIPRRASQEDLADHYEISTSAVSKQLRRALTELIESSLTMSEFENYDCG